MRDRAVATTGVQPSRLRGLTLVELLVAITVLGLVAVLGWRGLDSIVRARVALTHDLEETRGMQLAFAQLQSDCEHLAGPAVLANRTPLAIAQDRLTLVRTVFADNQPSRLQVISYRVSNGVLTRRQSAATRDLRELDALWQSAVGDTGAGLPVVLQSDVTEMTLRVWLNGNWRGEIGPQVPPVATAASTPVATGLEVTVQLHRQTGNMKKIFLLGSI